MNYLTILRSAYAISFLAILLSTIIIGEESDHDLVYRSIDSFNFDSSIADLVILSLILTSLVTIFRQLHAIPFIMGLTFFSLAVFITVKCVSYSAANSSELFLFIWTSILVLLPFLFTLILYFYIAAGNKDMKWSWFYYPLYEFDSAISHPLRDALLQDGHEYNDTIRKGVRRVSDNEASSLLPKDTTKKNDELENAENESKFKKLKHANIGRLMKWGTYNEA